MKKFLMLGLLTTTVIFAQTNEQEIQLLKGYGKGVATALSHQEGVNAKNIKNRCETNLKDISMSLEKTPEHLQIATQFCESEWKSH